MIQLKTANGKVALSQSSGTIEFDKTLIKGEDGGYYIPYVDENIVLHWTPSKPNEMYEPPSVSIKGEVSFDTLTESQKQEIIEGVLNALPNWDGVRF